MYIECVDNVNVLFCIEAQDDKKRREYRCDKCSQVEEVYVSNLFMYETICSVLFFHHILSHNLLD